MKEILDELEKIYSDAFSLTVPSDLRPKRSPNKDQLARLIMHRVQVVKDLLKELES